MKARMNQLVIQVLLMIIITAIVTYTCVNLAELIDIFSDEVAKVLTRVYGIY